MFMFVCLFVVCVCVSKGEMHIEGDPIMFYHFCHLIRVRM